MNAANGNGTYTFGGLTVNTGTPHSGNSTCAGGWALIVIYQSATERLRAINVFDGLDYFYGSALTLTPDGFRVPPANIDGRIAVFTLDGDPGNSTTLNGVDEALRFNGNTARRRPRAGGQRTDRAAVRRHHQHVGRRRPATASTSTSTTSARLLTPGRPAAPRCIPRARTWCCSWRRS